MSDILEDFMMKIDQIEIKSHGNLHVDPDSVFVCPECGADSASGCEGEGVEFRLSWKDKCVKDGVFTSVYADIFTCHCENCGCKWEEKRGIFKEKNWSVIVGIASILFVILTIIFAIVVGGETPPTPT